LLDQFERNFSFHRLGLLGDSDFAHPALADLFLQRVATCNLRIWFRAGVKLGGHRAGGGTTFGLRSVHGGGFGHRVPRGGSDGGVDDYLIDERAFEPIIAFEMSVK
jgi:hypothetical protein